MANKEKIFLIPRVDKIESTPIFNAEDEAYQFGAVFTKRDALAASATVVVEQSSDRLTWQALVTFSLDTTGTISTPSSNNLIVDGLYVRARVSAFAGNATLSVWMQ